jgi:methionine synthase II (cobalamin-independent)
MPGEDYLESTRMVFGEVPELPHLVELPSRGPNASMVGRTLALVTALGADWQPAGWRLTASSGLDHRRAKSLLSFDLDVAEELAPRQMGSVKVQLAGPWTLAAAVERPRGDKVLADTGARRDLAQALAEGAKDHVIAVQGRFPGSSVVAQVDEPFLPAVMTGGVATASGLQRHRAVTAAEAAEALGWVLDAVAGVAVSTVVHCCAPEVPMPVLAQTSANAVSFDMSLATSEIDEDLGSWVDDGRSIWLGVVPTTEPTAVPSDGELTRDVLSWWSRLGHSEVDTLPATTVTPACGLAGATPRWAREALSLCSRVATNLSEQEGRMSR